MRNYGREKRDVLPESGMEEKEELVGEGRKMEGREKMEK